MRAAGGPGRIRTGFFRVRGGCPAVGRQAQWLRVWDLHPPAWLMRPDWNYLQQTRVGCSGRTRTCIWRLMRPLWNPSRHAAVLVESWGFEPQSSPCRGDILPLDDDPTARARPSHRNKLPVGDTDGPECQSLRTPGLEASGRGASQRQPWWTPAGSNRRPPRCKRGALPLS